MPSVAQRQSNYPNIYLAASDNDIDAVSHFLNSGTDINSLDDNGYSVMHAAASYNHIALLNFLIEKGGNVNLEDNDGDTPLFVAETRETVNALVAHGANVTHRNHDNKTALEHHVEEDDFPDVIAALKIHAGDEDAQESSTLSAHYETVGSQDQVQRTLDAMDGLPVETREKLGEVTRKASEDGIDRDDEIRSILQEALLGHRIIDDRSRQRTESI